MHQAQREDGGTQVRGRVHLVPAPVCWNDQCPGTDATRISIKVFNYLISQYLGHSMMTSPNNIWHFQDTVESIIIHELEGKG